MEDFRRRNCEAMEDFRRRNCEAMEEFRRRNVDSSEAMEEELRRQNLEASKTIEELKRLLIAAEMNKKASDRTVEDLKRQKMEADEVNERLRAKIARLDEVYEVTKKKFESLLPKLAMVEEGLRSMCARNRQANLTVKYPETEDLSSPTGEKSEKDTNNVVDVLHSSCSSTQSGMPKIDPFLIIGNGDETRPGETACTSSPDTNLGEKEKICEKSPSSSSTFDLNSSHLKRKISSHENNNGNIHTSQQKKKQIRESTHESDEMLNNFLGKLNLGFGGTEQATLPLTSYHVIRRCKEKAGAECDSIANLPNFINLSDEESTDSEDGSCSDSDLNEAVDSVRSLKYCRTWMFGVDMMKDFEKDVELCMNAVCALYRHQISTSESGLGSSGGLGHFNALSGCSLAEYLIDGDVKLRLRKSADEVKQQRPEVLDQCRKLAKDYWVKLFSIYCSGEDPFFKSV